MPPKGMGAGGPWPRAGTQTHPLHTQPCPGLQPRPHGDVYQLLPEFSWYKYWWIQVIYTKSWCLPGPPQGPPFCCLSSPAWWQAQGPACSTLPGGARHRLCFPSRSWLQGFRHYISRRKALQKMETWLQKHRNSLKRPGRGGGRMWDSLRRLCSAAWRASQSRCSQVWEEPHFLAETERLQLQLTPQTWDAWCMCSWAPWTTPRLVAGPHL